MPTFENRPENPLELLPPSKWDTFKHLEVPFDGSVAIRSHADTHWMAACALMAYARPYSPDFANVKFKAAFEWVTKSPVGVFAGSGKHGANWYLIEASTFRVLAFRGSEVMGSRWDGHQFLEAFKDWLVTDADLNLVPWRDRGRVHDGFATAYDDVCADILSKLIGNKELPIFVTGHSLGGGMAALSAAHLTGIGFNVTAYTFGAPRVGDQTFVDSCVNIPTFRFVNSLDIVPQVPPHSSIFGGSYRHHATVTRRYSFSLRSSRNIVDSDFEQYIAELAEHEIVDSVFLVRQIFSREVVANYLRLIRPIVDHAPALYSIAAYNDWLRKSHEMLAATDVAEAHARAANLRL